MLHLYPGNGKGKLKKRKLLYSGFKGFQFVGAGDVTGNGRPDFFALSSKTGNLFLYPSNGKGGFNKRKLIGKNWPKSRVIFSPGDFNKDGFGDLMMKDSNGKLWLYRSLGHKFAKRVQIGSGWKGVRDLN